MKLLTNYLSNTNYDNAIANEDMCYPNTSFIQETSSLYLLNDKVDYSTQYFNLTPYEDANITIIPSGSTFYSYGQYMYISYSIDNCETWNQVPTDTNATVSVKAGDKIYLKASVYQHHAWSGPADSKIYKCNKPYTISGNILSLIYEDDFLGDDIIAQDTLSGYFANDKNLVDAQNLYLTSNMESCAYACMFKGCTSLINIPQLPTTLVQGCYEEMFAGCTSLTTAPKLPATTLAPSCYSHMFFNCTSLVTAPELPATTLADNCYDSMFYNCTSLATTPELPATTLMYACYAHMFQGCTSLTNAPELPATKLASECYYGMFSGCTSLTTVPELPATTLTDTYSCYESMFQGCTSLATAPKLPATTLADKCYKGMFSGCTSLTTTPELPTTIARYCYQSMFQGCTSLATAPELPATTLEWACYESMFLGCTSLSNITMLATDISATSCLYNWVKNVASTGTFTKHPNMTTLPTGERGIPEGWTVVDYAA